MDHIRPVDAPSKVESSNCEISDGCCDDRDSKDEPCDEEEGQSKVESSNSKTSDDCCKSKVESNSKTGDNRRDETDLTYVSWDEEEGHKTIVVLSDKQQTEDSESDDPIPTVPNECAICLEEYHEGDTIVWSTNQNCQHAFHRDCLASYLAKVTSVENSYPCPCCRQNFFEKTLTA